MQTRTRSLLRGPAWAAVSLLVVVSLLATSLGPVLTPLHAASRPVVGLAYACQSGDPTHGPNRAHAG